MKCAKCQSEMEKGFVKGMAGIDHKEQWGKGVDWKNWVKEGINVETYRCKNCGFLESYAK